MSSANNTVSTNTKKLFFRHIIANVFDKKAKTLLKMFFQSLQFMKCQYTYYTPTKHGLCCFSSIT